MIINEVQLILDEVLFDKGIKSYWNESEEPDKEYVVFRINSDNDSFFTDDNALLSNDNVTIRYYYDSSITNSKNGRSKIYDTAQKIKKAFEQNGFTSSSGLMFLGKLGDSNVETCAMELERMRMAYD